jgi:ring-1,2-phenylacetyl-CoA epoxidase subunit PaaC
MESVNYLYNYTLRLADSNMIHAQRLSEWCSKGPFLEEDIALTNIALDLLGQAEMFYDYAASLKQHQITADELAFRRNERQYFNTLMVELPNGDFAQTMLKIFFYAAYSKVVYDFLSQSSDQTLMAIAAKAVKEVRYHLRHSSEWIIRFGKGTEESKTRLENALMELWRFTEDMFLMNDSDKNLILKNITVDSALIRTQWRTVIEEVFEQADIKIPDLENSIIGGYNGIHTEYLGHLLCEMQFLQRAYPDAQW